MRNRILTVLGVSLAIGLVLYFLGFRMTKDDLHISAAPEPLFCLGGQIEGEHCSAGTFLPITNSVVMTIITDLLLVLVIVLVGRNLQLVPRGFQNLVEVVIEFFYNFSRGVDPKNVGKLFSLAATIFLFFLVANYASLVPGVGSIGVCRPVSHSEVEASEGGAAAEPDEAGAMTAFRSFPGYCDHHDNLLVPALRAPAADLNVTFAFALVAGIMIEVWGFQALGIGYLSKFYINPFKEGFLMAFVGILELIGEFTRIISFSFRIFGNIFGGEVILAVMSFFFVYLLPLPFYGLEVFVAFIQAAIFAVLTVIFGSVAMTPHSGHAGEEHEVAH
jgi:F-type H+-transporting ATPase subunit a